MTIKSQIVLVLALSAVVGAFGAPRSPKVCRRVVATKNYMGFWGAHAQESEGRSGGDLELLVGLDADGRGVVYRNEHLDQAEWAVDEKGRIQIDGYNDGSYELTYRVDEDAMRIEGGRNFAIGSRLSYLGDTLPVKDAQVVGAGIWRMGFSPVSEECALYGDVRQMQSVDELPDLAAMLDAGNSFYLHPEGVLEVDLRPHAIATNLLDGAILARAGGKGWSPERTASVFRELQSLGIACALLQDHDRIGIHFTAERSQLKGVARKLRACLADLPWPCKCISGETPSGWIRQNYEWLMRRNYKKIDLDARKHWTELSKRRSAECGRTVETCKKMMKSKSYEGEWGDYVYTLVLTKDGEGVLDNALRKAPLRWKADKAGHISVELYRECDRTEKVQFDYLAESDLMVVPDGLNGNGEIRNNYLAFWSATVSEEPPVEEIPNFDNPLPPEQCERLAQEGRHGILRMDSLDALPDFAALTRNHEFWEMVDDAYPRVQLEHNDVFPDAVDVMVGAGRYSPKSRTAPIRTKYHDSGGDLSGPDVTEGWPRDRLTHFINAMRGHGYSRNYSGKFTYSREDVMRKQLIREPSWKDAMACLRKELADMKFPRYYRVGKLDFHGKRPEDAPEKKEAEKDDDR